MKVCSKTLFPYYYHSTIHVLPDPPQENYAWYVACSEICIIAQWTHESADTWNKIFLCYNYIIKQHCKTIIGRFMFTLSNPANIYLTKYFLYFIIKCISCFTKYYVSNEKSIN